MLSGLAAMELKVWVDGIQRVVCGVSEQTTCQEVVIALAQAIGEFPEARMGPAGATAVGPGLWAHVAPRRVGLLLVPLAFPQLLKPDRLRLGMWAD